MNQEQKAQNDINRATYAEQVLENPLYKEAFIAMRADIIDKFGKTKHNQADKRDELWRQQQTLDRFEHFMRQTIQNGRIAASTMDKIKTAFKRI